MVAVGGVGHMAGSYQAHTQLSPSGGHGGAAGTPPPGRVGVGVLTMHRGDTGTPPLSGGPGGHPNHMSGPHGPHHGSGSVVHQGVHHGHGSSHSHGSAHGGPHGGSPHPHHSPGQHHQVIAPRAMPMSPSVASGIGASAVCAATSSQMLRSASPQPHHPLHATQHPQHPQGLLPHIHPQQQQPGGPQQQIQTSQQQSQVQGNQLPGNVHPKVDIRHRFRFNCRQQKQQI